MTVDRTVDRTDRTVDRTEAAAKAAWDANRKPILVGGKDFLDWDGEALPAFFREREMKSATDALAAADAHDRANGIGRIRLDDGLAEKIAQKIALISTIRPLPSDYARAVLDLLQSEALDASPGDKQPQASEPESMVWEALPNSPEHGLLARANQIVAWVNANGGEARYEQVVQDGSRNAGQYLTSRIAVRTSRGWQCAKPGDRIVKGEWVMGPDQRKEGWIKGLREFTVSPVESSGSAK